MRYCCSGKILLWMVTAVLGVFGSGCSIGYRNHHDSDLLRLYRSDGSAADPSVSESVRSGRVLTDIDPTWAKRVLRTFERDFGVPLNDVTPVRVYINSDESSKEHSHFNRLTRSIVLKVGQAELPRIYVHEISHLFLNAIESVPPYWIDQGLAEYMESRYVGNAADPWTDLVPQRLDWSAMVVNHIGFQGSVEGASPGATLKARLTREAIEEGRGWSVPFIHYLFAHRWEHLPMAKKVRLLLELEERDFEILGPVFLEYCQKYSTIDQILGRQ